MKEQRGVVLLRIAITFADSRMPAQRHVARSGFSGVVCGCLDADGWEAPTCPAASLELEKPPKCASKPKIIPRHDFLFFKTLN
ncbi:Hypothetical predicted protein [Scomber scombrus]|uniref:Uncharacterized protein n=1 Tax=Scomber scombrus TaxID=13677 RepID=A0AAV1N212_SCOSC